MYKTTKQLRLDRVNYRSLCSIFYTFKLAHQELYLVGGCVRDLLLGRQPKDYDLCTSATPDVVKRILSKESFKERYRFIDTGLKHGTVTIHDLKENTFYEITTYRFDMDYEDHRHPKEVVYTLKLEEDLKRRDFTINSFAYDPTNQTLVMLDESYLDDLEVGIIRTVGNPIDRFNEDALRMLRALRFASQLGFVIETKTHNAIKECAPLLKSISKERIRDELTKILLSDNPRYLEFLVCDGLEPYLFGINDRYPELGPKDYSKGITPIEDMIHCEHQNPWHYTDVFHHTLDVIERVPKKFELRWAAFFHDIGKPSVKMPRPQGPEGHFVYYGHPEVSTQISLKIMQILKFSKEQIDLITKFIKYHDSSLDTCKMSMFKKVLNDIGVEHFVDFMQLRVADSSAHQLTKDTKYAIDAIDKCYERYLKVISEHQAMTLKDLKIDGYYLISKGLQGKQIGDCLGYLLEKVLDKPELNNEKSLQNMVEKYIINFGGSENDS